MGISWKAMPLLSTLAALVIIVHSAEEDFEPDYRDVRPRRFDTVTSNYDQPWRILDVEAVATHSTQADWPVSSQEEPPKRRRPGRKRKRRPPPTSEEDLIPQERHVYQEEYRPYQHEKFNPQSGIIRRRRKQFDVRHPERQNSWTDETLDADRPLVRKRGHKRKRPLLEDTRPQLNEFDEYTSNDSTAETVDNTYSQPTETIIYEANHHYNNSEVVHLQNDDTIIKSDHDERDINKYKNYEANNFNTAYSAVDDTDISNNKNDDKSLSEFSLEIKPPIDDSDDIINSQEKISEKGISALNDVEKAKNNETLDPQILKQILKKSNGRSLSEILQQHNLSLVDLLRGKEKAISILTKDSTQKDESNVSLENIRGSKDNKGLQNKVVEPKPKASVLNTVIIKNIAEEQTGTNSEKPNLSETKLEHISKTHRYKEAEKLTSTVKTLEPQSNIPQNAETTETTIKSTLRRRFPVGVRRKVRIRPMNNTTYKSQLNRDLIALTSRRYQVNRNMSRSREWKDVMPALVKIARKDELKPNNDRNLTDYIIATTPISEVMTTWFEDTNISTLPLVTESDPSTTNAQSDNIDNTLSESTQTTNVVDFSVTENISTTTIITTSTTSTTTNTPITTERSEDKYVTRPLIKASDLRRQAFNNRLKRKRLKQKTTTTEPTHEYVMKDIFGMANLVSASEFIAKVQPRTTISDENQDFTTLEDFITTEIPVNSQSKIKSPKTSKITYSTTYATLPIQDMEETAKIEIEEILNDTRTSARLSKILKERNMTITELVEHRERGSSHVHLADIFHNTSREPNPPEPFLSKSLIEPISKETYPLRALLEANLHDPTAKAIPIESNSTYVNNINIPVVMDFGNNVNENGENMGIMSLFDNFTKIIQIDTNVNKFKGQTTEINLPPNDARSQNFGTSRESRTLNATKDLITWKEIIAIMHRGQINNTNEVAELTTKEINPPQILKKHALEDLDADNDSLIMINELHRLNDLDSQKTSTSEEDLKQSTLDSIDLPQINGVLNKTTDSAKAVTVATASIIGLAMVLFLLTYVAFRWKQQRNVFRKKQTLRRDRIPTPVFENRKGHKINSSTRSKSPMISSSNIYSIDTLDTRTGNDSPEYMWDSLRKPFQ